MSHVYATRDDWIEIFQRVESIKPLVYRSCWPRSDSDVPEFGSGLDLPDLGTAEADSSPCGSYLVAEHTTKFNPRLERADDGTTWCYIDQMLNPDTITIDLGGVWQPQTILMGRVATISDTTIGRRLLRRFQATIRKRFAKIGAFRVGPEAERLLDQRWRLTIAVQSPPEYDLVRRT